MLKPPLLLDHASITQQTPASQSTCYVKMKCAWGNRLSIICQVSNGECVLCLAPISQRWITFISTCQKQWGKFIEHMALGSQQGWHHHRVEKSMQLLAFAGHFITVQKPFRVNTKEMGSSNSWCFHKKKRVSTVMLPILSAIVNSSWANILSLGHRWERWLWLVVHFINYCVIKSDDTCWVILLHTIFFGFLKYITFRRYSKLRSPRVPQWCTEPLGFWHRLLVGFLQYIIHYYDLTDSDRNVCSILLVL